jgi:RNA recognition motif-containing protein
MTIFISNLPLSLIEADVQRLFVPFGEVRTVRLTRDKLNNRPRGSAKVSMPVHTEAQNAITGLDGVSLHGRTIRVEASGELEED